MTRYNPRWFALIALIALMGTTNLLADRKAPNPGSVTIFADSDEDKLKNNLRDYLKHTKPGMTEKQLAIRARIIARMLAELGHRNKENGRKSYISSLPFMVDFLSEKFGDAAPKDDLRAKYQFEWLLTSAIVEREPEVSSACDALKEVVEKYDSWRRPTSDEEVAREEEGTSGVRNTRKMAVFAIEALALIRAKKALSSSPDKLPAPDESNKLDKALQYALDRWTKHPEMRRLINESSPGVFTPEIPSQYLVWGKVFSSLVLKELENNPSLRAYLPTTNFGAAGFPSPDLFRQKTKAMQESLLHDVANFPRTLSGPGGSFFHMHLLSTSMLALSDKQADAHVAGIGRLITAFEKAAGRAQNGHSVPYSPFDAPRNPRSSAARSVPYFFAKLLRGTNDETARNNLLVALRTFVIHSGSLMTHVARNETHLNGDGLAPYYWAPTIPTAVAAGNVLETLFETGSKEHQEVQFINSILRYTVLSQVSDGRFMDTGEQYGSDSSSWTTGLPAMALAQLCENEKGYRTAGIFDGSLDGEIEETMAKHRRRRNEEGLTRHIPGARRTRPTAGTNH